MKVQLINEELNEINEALDEEHPIAKRIFNDLDSIENLCNQTYNWEDKDWNNRKTVEMTADLISQFASDIKDALSEYYDK